MLLEDTTRLWDLVAAAFEEANIRYDNLSGKQAKKVKCWSKNAYQKSERNVLQGREDLETSVAQITKAEWLREIPERHTVLGNKVQNIARRMKINESKKSKEDVYGENVMLDNDTKRIYLQEAGQMARQRSLADNQKKQIREEWDKKIEKGEKASDETNVGKRMRNVRST